MKYINSIKILALFCMVFSAALMAEDMSSPFGIKGGYALSNTKITGVESSAGGGYLAGVGFDMGSGALGLNIDFIYVKRSYSLVSLVDVTKTELYIPVLARLRLFGAMSLVAGPYVQYGLGKIKVSAFGVSADETYSEYGSKQLDYGTAFGVGFKFPMKSKAISFEARYNLGLADLNKTTVSGFTQKDNSIDLLLGFWF
jgi:hypothetical protein